MNRVVLYLHTELPTAKGAALIIARKDAPSGDERRKGVDGIVLLVSISLRCHAEYQSHGKTMISNRP